jgi:glucan phosphoethanolaminetransferase (alkaline phosphatase superfamily)
VDVTEDMDAKARDAPWPRLGLLPILLIPGAVCVGLDLGLRGERIRAFFPELGWPYALAVVQSFLVWAGLLFATTTNRGWLRWALRLVFVGAFTLALGGQVYFFGQYRAYLTRSVAAFAVNMIDSVRGQLLADLGNVARTQLPFAAIATLLVLAISKWPGRRLPASRRFRWSVPLLLLVTALAPPVHFGRQQAATPDTLYLNALGAFVRTAAGLGDPARGVRPRARYSLPLSKPLRVEREPKRNVLLVITESVRADAVCRAGDRSCLATPATHALLPQRISLERARALSSTTAISVAVLWSGLLPVESSDILHTWPLLFDYARAADWDTAYWTSQNLLFGNTRLWVKNLGARLTTSATELDPEADVDLGADEALLARHVSENISQLREPFFAVVHLSNTHYPYFSDAQRGEPAAADGPGVVGTSAYRRAIFQQDQHVATMLAALRATEPGKRTVIVFTSDHGEAFQEHRQSGHTLSVYDEELRVPCFVDAPPSTLSAAERSAVISRERADVFHTDVVPTVLDLMGLLDANEFAAFAARLPGQSWLRPARTMDRIVPLTNCSPLWSCAFENWGVMRGSLKLIAQTHPEHGERCFDLAADPGERASLPLAACSGLRPAFYTFFSRLPE